MKQVHVFISGSVQGVGYRYFVRIKAQGLGLRGWAKNLEDGRVECLFQGEAKEIEEMLKICRNGSFLAEVKDVEVVPEDVSENFLGFEIR